MNPGIHIEEEAYQFYKKHYPYASDKEMEKQIKDWRCKISASEGLVAFFRERVGEVRGKKMLDVGFGSGGISTAFALAGAIVSAVDVEPDLKPIAEKNLATYGVTAELQIYDGRVLPYESNSFDYVICSSVLEHTTYPEDVVREILRVLKPSGRVFLALPNKYYPKETHTLAYFVSYMPRSMANAYLKMLKRSPLEHDNLHFYSYFDVMKMLKKTGIPHTLLYKDPAHVSGIKKSVMLTLKKFNIHYTIFLKQLMFVIEKK